MNIKSISELIKEKQLYLKEYNDYVRIIQQTSWNIHSDKITELSLRRGIPTETLLQHGIFYIDTYQELLAPQYIDKIESFGLINELNKQPIFHERWIIPIKDFSGNIINLVGYSPDSPNRYVYGTAKYYDRKNDMFGMEYYKAASEHGWAIYLEGITDCIAMRSLGYWNSFASCGTMSSDLKMRHLNQLENGVIFITDRDKAGDNTLKHWKTNACVYISIGIETYCKDIDDFINKNYNTETGEKEILPVDSELRLERAQTVRNTITSAVEWLKEQGQHDKTSIKNIRYANISLY